MPEIYTLTNQNIDLISEEMAKYYEGINLDSKKIYAFRLTLEEALLEFKEILGEKAEVEIGTSRIFKQHRFTVSLKGREINPFENKNEDNEYNIINYLSSNYDKDEPSWSYDKGINKITFIGNKKVKVTLLLKILIAIVISAILGIIARNTMDETLLQTICTDYLTPLGNIFSGLLMIMGVIFAFLNVAFSLTDLGNISNAGKMIKRLMLCFLLIPLGFVALFSIGFVIKMGFTNVGNTSTTLKNLFDTVVGFFPNNVISPFLEFNVMQVMIIGVMFGLSMLVLGEKTNTLKKIFSDIQLVAIQTNSFITSFIYIYVFITLFVACSTQKTSVFRYSLMLIVYCLIAIIVLLVAFVLYISIKLKVRPGIVIKKLLPTFLICITTSNYGSAFAVYIDNVLGDCGVDPSYCCMGLQLGGTLFRPALASVYIISIVYMCNNYSIPISAIWYVVAILLCVFFSFSTPNMIGGPAIIIPLLFSQCGVPYEGLAWMLTLITVLQFPICGADTVLTQMLVIINAAKENKIDLETLRKKKA